MVPMTEECAFLCKASGTHGMSLREYFAAHAPNPPKEWNFNLAEGETFADKWAHWAFQYADAMMARREFDRKINSRMV